VNTSDADLVSVYTTKDVTAVSTWNPLLSEIEAMPDSYKVFDSSKIPGEIIDLLVINTETLKKNPKLGKALVGAWYEIMQTMSGSDDAATKAKTFMAEASGTDLAGYEAQLASTEMFYTPKVALDLVNSDELVSTMEKVANFSFTHGLLGDGAPDAGFIGVEMPKGTFGDKSRAQKVAIGLLPFVLLLILYIYSSDMRLAVNPDDKLLPSISKISSAVDRMAFTASKRTGEYLFWQDTFSSLQRLSLGVVIASVIGLIIGMFTGALPLFKAGLSPLLTVISLIPPLAVLPILFIVFGLGEVSKVVLIAAYF